MSIWTRIGIVLSIAVLGCGPASADETGEGRTLELVSVRADTVQAARAIDNDVVARYPASAVSWRREGRAVVAATIAADGHVERVELRESSGYASLDRAALTLVRGQRFAPATRDGESVATHARVPVSFELAANR